MSEFSQDLILLTIDKFVFALVLGAGAFWLNHSLERFRSQAALRNEFAKITIEKMGEVWSRAYEWERVVAEIQRLATGPSTREEGEDMETFFARVTSVANQIQDELNQKATLVGEKIEEERFWLTNDVYKEFIAYQRAMEEFLFAVLGQKGISQEAALRNLEEVKPNAHRMIKLFA